MKHSVASRPIGATLMLMMLTLGWNTAAIAEIKNDKKNKNEKSDKREENDKKEKKGAARFDAGRNGLSYISRKKNFNLNLGGRLHYDVVFHEQDRRDLDDDSDLRRARVEIKMTLKKKWQLKSQFEFSGSEIEAKDQYLRYSASERTSYTVGHFKEAFSLEELNSSNQISFIERALPVAAFAPSRALGFAVSRSGKRSSLTVGIFDGPLVLEGDVAAEDKGQSSAVRGTWAPLLVKGKFVHVGAALERREFRENVEPRFSTKPESGPTSERFVNTGGIKGVENLLRVGLEIAAGRGPLLFQAEAISTELRRPSFDTNDPVLTGWYAQLSWVFGSKARIYSPREGTLGEVIPRDRSGWEVAVRTSSLDLDDVGVEGGRETNWTLGVNWYFGRNIRLMANYIAVNSMRRGKEDDPKIFLLRAQVAF